MLMPYRSGMSVPVAYFITFSCYGRRLHGDDRGSVDGSTNAFGEEFLAPSLGRQLAEGERLRWPPMSLDMDHRLAVDAAIREVCKHREWTLHALNVRTNHVHVVVAAEQPIERVLSDFKRYATRRMVERGLIEAGRRPWADHGSTRYVWDVAQLARVCAYVAEGQGVDLREGEEARKGDSGPVGYPPGTDRRVGLCSLCTNVQRIVSARGAVFWLCTLAKEDGRFRKYPALPVLKCSGFEARQ